MFDDASLMWNVTPIPSQSVSVLNPLNVRQTRAVATALVMQNQTLALAKGIRRSPLDTAATVPSGTLGFTVRFRYASRTTEVYCYTSHVVWRRSRAVVVVVG